MSLATDRDAIAASLADVDGVTGYPMRPKALSAGDAWPLLSSLDRGPGESWQATWRVLLCLGGSEVDATLLLDQVLADVLDALGAVSYVEGVTPVLIAATGGDMFAAEFRLRSE